MSKDNLLLFPKKSKPVLEMTEKELRWALSGTLVLIFALSLGLNGAIFGSGPSGASQASPSQDGRDIASPMLAISWEKRTLAVLEESAARDVASLGESPSLLDQLSLGALEGNYTVQTSSGNVTEIQLSDKGGATTPILNRLGFVSKHRQLFGPSVTQVRQVFADSNGRTSLERYELLSDSGQPLGLVVLTLDKNQGLLSASVQ